MALHHLTCPSCGAGFDSKSAAKAHVHRDATPRERDILTCPECKVDFAARPEKHGVEAENQRKAIDRSNAVDAESTD